MDRHQASQETKRLPFWGSRFSLGLMGFSAVALYFLLSEHRAHFMGMLPILLLLACPLMHVFMHHGHGGHGGSPPPGRDSASSDPTLRRGAGPGGQP